MPDLQTIKSAYENIINQKTFENQLIKELFTHTIEVCYFIEGLDKKNIIDRLLKLNDNFNEHIEIKAHICQLLFLLEAYSECSKIITPMFDKNTYSELGFLYARATYRSNTNLQELLLYFKGLRVNNNKSPFEFLALEYNIRINISDYENIIDICWRGIEQYPDIEEFHSNLLNALANKNQIDNIQKYLNTNYKNDYENEETGLIACRSLQKTGYKKQAAEILYNLSIKIQNSKSRTYYLTLLEFPDGFLSEYDVVENSSYIKIQNGDDTKLLKVNSKDHNQYIGKNLNDTVLINKRGLEFESYSITRIMNAHLFLLEQIMEEAATGNSNLGVEILNFTQNGNIDFKAFEKYFIDRFGVENELQNVKRAKKLDNYYLGKENFSMICRNVFNENLLEAYLFLCQNQFVALSKTANSQISLFPDNIYVLDFTSLILFSDLKADYSITFGTKFRISPNLIKLLRDQHLILKSEKNEKMSLAVSENKVKKILYPDDFNQKILSLYEKIFAFIDSECIEYIIEEEVDLITEFKRKNEQDTYFNYLMDNCLMCSNLKFILISNDTFIIDAFQNIDRYIISPERFINTFGNDDTNLKALNYYIQKNMLEYQLIVLFYMIII
ncbi:MAG: hypothetical protein M0D57_00745 [Sphingobacteriales bacterium JAD_PAG50586_3]|nr:MAG: hypothetical protein M0D57_00745 [Sphingobacteriales bacterium JAD_PAG50586_3]